MKRKCLMLMFAFALSASMVTAQKKYAVLITGDYAASSDTLNSNLWNGGRLSTAKGSDEFWNDTFLMWKMLQEKGFNQEDIFVLFANGIDFYLDDTEVDPAYRPTDPYTTVTDYSATLENVNKVFNNLLDGNEGFPKMTEDDFLFVWVFDHGGLVPNDHSYIRLMNDKLIIDYEFAQLVNPLPAHKKVFWMQQCNSGGFVDDLENESTVFLSACQANQGAHPADDNPN
ncbi:MAG: C13 family peptidase [Salinivirgaceae bacterium]|nr:C13 family peptidase [Salinivirgaceae bacterium]